MDGKAPSEPQHHPDCFLCNGSGEWLWCAHFGLCDFEECRRDCNCYKQPRGWTDRDVYNGSSHQFED
uniref:Uncharacterized protein n=1 Tax=Streptomyces sp. NBC_01393 TaxID=2903851 RepID=A0AAU3IA42_9ACTN